MEPLLAGALADAVMSAHFAFVVFVVLGAALVLWRPALVWLHLPCALYGLALEFYGWTCPLTPVEKSLRYEAGQGGYEGGFVEHYIGGLLYPENWGEINHLLGFGLLAVNAVLYGLVVTRWRRAGSPPTGAPQRPARARSAAASRSGVPTSSQEASPTSKVASG